MDDDDDEEGSEVGDEGADGGGVGYGGGLEDEIWIVDFLLELEAWFTVDNCSWINIMWSPSLIVRLRGAAPDKKSFT